MYLIHFTQALLLNNKTPIIEKSFKRSIFAFKRVDNERYNKFLIQSMRVSKLINKQSSIEPDSPGKDRTVKGEVINLLMLIVLSVQHG